MSDDTPDLRALQAAFEAFTKTNQTLEASYRLLETRVQALDHELAVKNRELAFTIDYLDSILESMSDGVIAVDPQGVVTAFNRAASDILGFAGEDVVGRSFDEVFLRPFAAPAGRRVMELITRDGRALPVREQDSPMEDRTGARIGAVKVFHDLSEIEELRAQVRQKERLAALGEMSATVAHEIRNPLGGIRGFAELLARDIDAEDQRLRLVDRILQGTRDLEQVVSDLLEYTRPLQLNLQRTACAALVEEAIGYLGPDHPGIAVANEVPAAIEADVDRDKMRQVFLNILLNAVQSIEGEGEVRILGRVETDTVSVTFRDTGCGMSEEQSRRAFSPYYTTKEQGAGLGLAIAAKIVEGHGGAIDAISAPGAGSAFRVRLPRPQ